MTEDDKQLDFLNHTSSVLDKSIDTIDDETARRLKQIRFQALQHKRDQSAWLKPLTTLAATAAVLVLTVTFWLSQPAAINDALVLEDISLLTTHEELDFYQELEFYNWLDDEQING